MPDQSKETVIVIHGTYAAPAHSSINWYEPEGSFCQKLDEALRRQGTLAQKPQDSIAATWKHNPNPKLCEELNSRFANSENQSDGDYDWFAFMNDEENDSPAIDAPSVVRPWKQGDRLSFFWDGMNNWKSRQDAADLLRRHLIQLHKEGWRCHIVAHSHGGNVVLDAFKYEKDKIPEWFAGHIVLLGTPVIESVQSKIFELPVSFMRSILSFIFSVQMLRILYMVPLFVLIGYPVLKSDVLLNIISDWRWIAVICVLLYFVVFSALLFRDLNKISRSSDLFWTDPEPRRTSFLIISSPNDEALRLLKGVNRLYWKHVQYIRQRDSISSFGKSLICYMIQFWNALKSSIEGFRQNAGTIQTAPFFLLLALFSATVGMFYFNIGQNWTEKWFVYASVSAGLILLILALLFRLEFSRLYFLIWNATVITFNAFRILVSQFAQRTIGDNITRWAYIQLLGISGSPISASEVRVTSNPNSLDWCLYEHKKLDDLVERTALNERIESVKETVASLNEILAKGEWSSNSVVKALKNLNLPTLVHTYYYQSDNCIELIAEWLTRTNDDAEKKWKEYYPDESIDTYPTLSQDEREGWEDRVEAYRDPVRKRQINEEF